MANLIRSDIRIFQERLEFFIKQSKTDKFKECTRIVISPTGITVCPKTHLLVYMKLTNISDLSNYIFQSVVKLSQVVSFIKVGSCHTLEQERFCWEIGKKVGLPKGSFGLHSLRSGGATAAGNVVSERLIQSMSAGRQRAPKTGTYTSFISENVANKYDKRIHLYFHLWLLIAFWLPVLYCRSAGCWHILYSC